MPDRSPEDLKRDLEEACRSDPLLDRFLSEIRVVEEGVAFRFDGMTDSVVRERNGKIEDCPDVDLSKPFEFVIHLTHESFNDFVISLRGETEEMSN